MRESVLAIVFLVAIDAGCTHATITPLTPSDVLENGYVSFRGPGGGGWYVFEGDTWHKNGRGEIRNLSGARPGTHYAISVNTYPDSPIPSKGLFDPKYQGLPRGYVALNDNDREQGITYKRTWTTYVSGLRCYGGVFSRRFGGSAYQAMSKNYSMTCGYYDKAEGKRILFFLYDYNYALGDTRLQEDEGKKRSELLTQAEAEAGLKQGMKELVDSLEIKNLDRERMEREGLWFPGRPFDASEF